MLAFTEILKSHISEIKIDINLVRPRGRGGGGGVGGPDDQIHSCHPETSDPLSSGLGFRIFSVFQTKGCFEGRNCRNYLSSVANKI